MLHQNSFDAAAACLQCIYPPTPREDSYFQHIAEQLGISLERVRSNELITTAEAQQITAMFPDLSQTPLVGKPYESAFKQLCSAGQLRVQSEDKVVLTSFAFISALAGVLLYFEFIKSLNAEVFARFQQYNYARLNPFFVPNPALREHRIQIALVAAPTITERLITRFGPADRPEKIGGRRTVAQRGNV